MIRNLIQERLNELSSLMGKLGELGCLLPNCQAKPIVQAMLHDCHYFFANIIQGNIRTKDDMDNSYLGRINRYIEQSVGLKKKEDQGETFHVRVRKTPNKDKQPSVKEG